MNKKLVSISLGAGLVVGSAAGLIAVPAISGAQTANTTAATAPANRPDPSVRLNETLKPLVDAGTISQAQADAVIAALKADMPARGERGHKGGAGLEVAAQALGMTADELHAALDGGQTLAQVASDKGVNVQVVVDALVASATNHINEEVASGEITQAQADQKLAELSQRVTDRVNNPRPEGGPRGGHGPKGAPADQAAPATN
jgi:DNA-binding IscR family transcriptional regulator